MPVFTVHLENSRAGSGAARLVETRFNRAAFLSAPLWLIAVRAWGALAGWFAVAAVSLAMAGNGRLGVATAIVSIFLAHILIGFEAPELTRRRLADKGMRLSAVVTNGNRVLRASAENGETSPSLAHSNGENPDPSAALAGPRRSADGSWFGLLP